MTPSQFGLSEKPICAKHNYGITETHIGDGFLQAFSFEAIRDPTHGRVNYVNEYTAHQEGLLNTTADSLILRADSWTELRSDGPGRNSFRLKSNRKYQTSVMVFDIRHMPQGCGTWPAVWTVGDDWPNQGELDILEGVNDQSPNQVTIHTNQGCVMPPNRNQTGTSSGDNCDVYATNNAGCGVKLNDNRSYGPTFNENGGGWIAVERTQEYAKAWFWPRDGNPPHEIRRGAQHVNPDSWGTPGAHFPSTSGCDLGSKFGPQSIVINRGDWAGSVYSSSGCPSTCENFVNSHPEAFVSAYFDIGSLRIYE
ncbi:2 beta-glucanase [Coprinopsis marcescibilis]|uniref:2 beta-glucanase n=1 Tax=Coprinopsis marcescibilis TaxID=230819 RepID=A0A5C3L0T2_COPMA|nr:2 beta-glucanase [Coprinopsis marcescibilis]